MRLIDQLGETGAGLTLVGKPGSPDEFIAVQLEGDAFPRLALFPAGGVGGVASVLVGNGAVFPSAPLGSGGGGGGGGNAIVTNVKDYGAVGDGTTDDTVAITAAITAAGTSGTVYFPDGDTYFCRPTTSTMKPLLGQTWTGTGTLKFDGAGQYGIDGSSTFGVTFDGLTFDGGLVDGTTANITTALDFSDSVLFTLRNCEVKNAVGKIVPTAGSASGVSGRCGVSIVNALAPLIDNNVIHDIGWHPGDDWKNYADTNGQAIRGPGARSGRITNNETYNHVSDGIFLGFSTNYTTDMTVHGNYVHDCMYMGINVFTSRNIVDGGQGITGLSIRGNLIRRTNGVERGNRPGKRTITVISGNGTGQIVVKLSAPIVGHPKNEKGMVFLPADGTIRGDNIGGSPYQSDSKASITWTNGASFGANGSSPAGSTMVSTDTAPVVTLDYTALGITPTLVDGDQIAVIETGESSAGIYTNGSKIAEDIVVADNTIEYCSEPGIEINDHPAIVRNNTVRDTGWVSWTTASDKPGIYLAPGSICENNTVVRAWGHGITCEDQNYYPGDRAAPNSSVTDVRGHTRTIVRNNTIIDCNYGGYWNTVGGLRTSWGPRRYMNSTAVCGINMIADYGNVRDCQITGNHITTANQTNKIKYAVRVRCAAGFDADASNDFLTDNTCRDVAADYQFRYVVNNATTASGYREMTATGSATAADRTILLTGASAIQVNLPLAVKAPLNPLTIINQSSVTAIIDAASTDLIGGLGSITLLAGAAVTLISDWLGSWYATADAKNTLVGFTPTARGGADVANTPVRELGLWNLTGTGKTATMPSAPVEGDEVAHMLVGNSGGARLTIAPNAGQTLELGNGSGNFVMGLTVGEGWVWRYDATNAMWRMRPYGSINSIGTKTRFFNDSASYALETIYDVFHLGGTGGQTTDFTIVNPVGTKRDGQVVRIRCRNSAAGVARAITWGTDFRALSGSLPATLKAVASAVDVFTFMWNANDSKYDLIGTA